MSSDISSDNIDTPGLGIQVHSGDGWDGVFDPQYVPDEGYWAKPPHAFWTSSLREDGSTGWADFNCMEPDAAYDKHYACLPHTRVLELHGDAHLYSLMVEAGLADDIEGMKSPLHRLVARAGLVEGKPAEIVPEIALISLMDPERMSALWSWISGRWDAVHVNPKGRRGWNFVNWDCESTAWFRPWENLQLLEPVYQPPRP